MTKKCKRRIVVQHFPAQCLHKFPLRLVAASLTLCPFFMPPPSSRDYASVFKHNGPTRHSSLGRPRLVFFVFLFYAQ